VAPRTNSDLDAVVEHRTALGINRRVSGHLVQLKRDLREVVELGDGGALDLCLEAALEDAVEQGVDVRLFGEVDEALGLVRRLHVLEVLDDLLEEREGCQEADFKLDTACE
jgi:hypothetical protein